MCQECPVPLVSGSQHSEMVGFHRLKCRSSGCLRYIPSLLSTWSPQFAVPSLLSLESCSHSLPRFLCRWPLLFPFKPLCYFQIRVRQRFPVDLTCLLSGLLTGVVSLRPVLSRGQTRSTTERPSSTSSLPGSVSQKAPSSLSPPAESGVTQSPLLFFHLGIVLRLLSLPGLLLLGIPLPLPEFRASRYLLLSRRNARVHSPQTSGLPLL